MPLLGPYIIQRSELVWLKIELDSQSAPTNPRIYTCDFNPSADGIPELFLESILKPCAFKAYDPMTQRYFVIAFTKNDEILRLRPTSHDAFMIFAIDNKTATPLPTFLEIFNGKHWMFTKKPIIKAQLEKNFFDLRNKLRESLQAKINSQYSISYPVDEWAVNREDFTAPIPGEDGELTAIGFYKSLLEIKKMSAHSVEYQNALTVVLTARSTSDIQQSQLPEEIKDEISILQRFFYDESLHRLDNNVSTEISSSSFAKRYKQMQEALFREDASLREVTNISFKSSLELRAIFFPPRIHELNAEEIAAELFRCRASSLYLEALGLTIDHGSNYVSQYFRADYIKMRKYIQYCEDMLNNHEYLWDAKDLFASYLLQENDAYNPDAELIQAMHKLQNQIKQLILNAITDSWIIASLLKVIANIDELVFAISKVNPEHELLNTENLLPYIHSLPDLISILKRIDNFDRQYQIVSACEVLLPENICQNITTIEQLKSLLSVISPVNRKTRTLIYNAYPTTDLVKLAKTAANFNELLLSFSSDCRNHLLKRNAVYCAKLIMNDDDLYLLLDKLQINHLTNLLYHIPLDIKICLLKDLNALSKVLTLVDSKISAYLLKLLPSITRLQSLHNATEREKLIFFRSVVPRGLQILFSSLSANEWYTLFPDTSLLLDLIAKLELSKQAFVDCIPKSVKLRIYQETNSHRENIQTSTKNIFHDFNDLKLLINKLINPPSAYSYLCFWKTKQKVYPNIHSISDLQILIIDNYLINPTMFNLSSAQRICEEYRARVPQTNQANIISNIKIL